jgi:hypothetical protein
MSQISVFAQPGATFIQAEQAARTNRLAIAAQQAERATEEAQRRAVQQILGVSAPTTGGEQFTRGGAAGVRGVTGGEVGAPITPSAPQARTGAAPQTGVDGLRYSEQQIRAMMVADPRLASEMRQQNEAVARQQERERAAQNADRTRNDALFRRAAERLVQMPENEDAIARALAEETNTPLRDVESRLRNERELTTMPRLAGTIGQLDEARRRGLISDDEYNSSRSRYLQGIGRSMVPGLNIEFDNDGNIVSLNMGESGATGARSSRIDAVNANIYGEALSTIGATTEMMDTLAEIRQQMQIAGEGSLGLLGSARATGAGILDQISILARYASENDDPFARRLADTARGAMDANNWASQGDRDRFFNNQISGVEFLVYSLAYSEARRRNPGSRLSNQMIRDTMNSMGLSNFRGDESFRVVLDLMERQTINQNRRAHETARNILQTGMPFPLNANQAGSTTPPAAAAPQSGAPATPRRADYSTLQEYLDAVDEALADG